MRALTAKTGHTQKLAGRMATSVYRVRWQITRHRIREAKCLCMAVKPRQSVVWNHSVIAFWWGRFSLREERLVRFQLTDFHSRGSGADEGMKYKVSTTGSAGPERSARGVQALAPCLGFAVCTGN